MLTIYDWVYGIATLTTVILAIFAGFLALSMFSHAKEKKYLAAWTPLSWALIFFMLVEIVGTLKIFGIWSTPWLTHVIPSIILIFLIFALVTQINVTKGCAE